MLPVMPQLVLVATLVLNQSPYTLLDHPQSPEANTRSQDDTAKNPADYSSPRKVVPSIVEYRTDSENSKQATGDINQQANREPQDKSRSMEPPPIAVVALVISVLSCVFAAWVAISTHRSAKAAEKGAQAAADSAEAAKQAVSSERAYMGIDVIHNTHQDDGFYLTVDWKNYGRMPAIVKSACTQCKLPDVKTDTPMFDPAHVATGDSKVGPNQVFPCGTYMISAEIRNQIIKKNGFAYLFAQLEYADVYDERVKVEEVILKVTRRTDWNGFVMRLKNRGTTDIGCFNILPVSWKSLIKP
jgi:hypothetical protein